MFEVAKSLSEKVREKTGLQEDGFALFNTAFSVNNPRLALNALQTSTEKNFTKWIEGNVKWHYTYGTKCNCA